MGRLRPEAASGRSRLGLRLNCNSGSAVTRKLSPSETGTTSLGNTSGLTPGVRGVEQMQTNYAMGCTYW